MSTTAALAVADRAFGASLRSLVRWGLFPIMLVVAALRSVAIAQAWLSPMAVQMSVFAVALTSAIAAERGLPFELRWRQTSKQERRVDAASMIVLMTVADPLLKRGLMPLLLSLTVSAVNPQGGLGLFPAEWPTVAQTLLAAVIAEFGGYWMHRASHAQRWMWNVHSLHHSPARLYWLNGFRVNPLNMAWQQMAGVFVVMLLGAPAATVQMFLLFATVVSVFQHVNADLRYSGWNQILATADLHRWHHDADTTQPVCNFGGVLMLWDRVFGTFRAAQGASPEQVGIADSATPPRSYLGWLRKTSGRS